MIIVSFLWSACRHHIGELMLSHLFSDLNMETSKSPNVTLFTRMRTHWNLLSHSSSQAVMFQPANYTSEAQKLLAARRDDTIACRPTQGVVEFVKDDYSEFTELSLVFLGHTKSEVSLCRPGALHKARWMAQVIKIWKVIKLQWLRKALNSCLPGQS